MSRKIGNYSYQTITKADERIFNPPVQSKLSQDVLTCPKDGKKHNCTQICSACTLEVKNGRTQD